MDPQLLRPCKFIPLKYITDIRTALKDEAAAAHMYRADTVYLLLTSDGRAISLGSGRYASVALGADRGNYEQANTNFLAIKFLKRDVDSDVASKIARTRFYEEIEKTRQITIHNIDLEGGFVGYKGFSSYKSLTSEQYDTEAAENLKSTFGEETIRSIVRENETRKDEIEKAVAFNLQGEFYVMLAESGTLDDILIYRQPWESRGLEGVRKSLASESTPDLLGRFRIERQDDLIGLLRDLNLEAFVKKGQDFSGFAILKEIGVQKPKERNRMVVELFLKITRAIQTVHRAMLDETEGYLAHRDIKPGNFLVRCSFPELRLLTSDLGFVSGSKAENLGAETIQVSVREPGVLAPGSYMFRAPEQMEQGYEINFQIEPDTHPDKHQDTGPASSTMIAFDNIGDKNIEPGDWFETDAVTATDGTRPPFKSYIERVDHERERVLVTLKDTFDYSRAYPVFHGHITRLSALHSDLFSLGCILYFLISGGKNPEKFYIKCLETSPFGRQHSGHAETQQRKEDDLYENCLRISATLCAEGGENIIREIECIGLDKVRCDNRNLLYSNDEIEFVKQLVTDRNILSVLGIGKLQGLRNYRQHLQSTGSVPYYVLDTSERPIPFAILYEIVRLLVRDKEDSYVSRIKPGNHARWAPSYFDLTLHEKTKEVYDGISNVLDLSMCCKKEIRDYAKLGDTRAEYFVMLRSCLGPELLNCNVVAPAGG